MSSRNSRRPLCSFRYVTWGITKSEEIIVSIFYARKLSYCLMSTYVLFWAARYPPDEGGVCGGVCYRLLNDVLIKKLYSKVARVWLCNICTAQSIRQLVCTSCSAAHMLHYHLTSHLRWNFRNTVQRYVIVRAHSPHMLTCICTML